jgi:hypothetical protein
MNVEPNINEHRKSGIERAMPTMHIGMGVVYLIMGVLIMYLDAFGGLALEGPWPYIIGGLMLLYGGFRLWRGLSSMRQRRS